MKPPTKMLSSVQAYTRLYYKKKLKAIVDPKWEEYLARNPDKQNEGLSYRNAAIKDIFDAETDEVKSEVEKRREEGILSEDEDIDPDDDDTVDAIERQRRSKAHAFQR